jgi:hypothetical protein
MVFANSTDPERDGARSTDPGMDDTSYDANNDTTFVRYRAPTHWKPEKPLVVSNGN